jgi:FMN reductase
MGTPVYRGSYTGALKNLLDHTPLEALMGKPVGLIATGATDHHYLAIDQELRTLLAWFNAFVVPGSVYVQGSHFQGEELTDERVRDHLRQLGESVVLLEARLRDAPMGPPPLAGWKRG